jgi:hypothetical protein
MRRRQQTMEERFLGGGPVHPEADRLERGPRTQMLLAGLRRFAIFTAAAAAAAAGLGVLAAYLRGGDLVRGASLGLYVGGALLVAFAAFTFSNQPRRWVDQYGHDLGAGGGGGDTGAFIAIGLALIGIGLLLEFILL